jgi:HEAT repeat protein
VARRRPLEETLAALRRVRESPHTEESRRELRLALESGSSHAVARAAALVGELGLDALVPELLGSFDRFFRDAVRSDPGCTARTAIVEALRRLDQDALDVFRRGAAHVQMEPVFGGRVDTAVELRAACALALAEQGDGRVLVDLAHLLADPEPAVRASAGRALSLCAGEGASPLLHFKALAGDEEPRVVSECVLSLVRHDADAGLRLAASLLEKDDARAEAAAVALGESRTKEALPVLRSWLPAASRRGLERAALLAIASLRSEEAASFLLSLVAEATGPTAREAVLALSSMGGGAIRHRTERAAAARPELADTVSKAFGAGPGEAR